MGRILHLWFCACKTECLALELLVPMGPAHICGFCMQNSDFWTRITSLYGSRLHLSFCECKTAWLASDLLVSMFSSPHLWFCACKMATLGIELQVSMGPRPHLLFCVCKTAWLAPELLVSTGPSRHLWFLHANSDFWTRLTNLYESQTSCVVLSIHNSVLSTRIKTIWVPALICGFVHSKQRP